jgi:hypothetical protein
VFKKLRWDPLHFFPLLMQAVSQASPTLDGTVVTPLSAFSGRGPESFAFKAGERMIKYKALRNEQSGTAPSR